jgi:hypothetical protein
MSIKITSTAKDYKMAAGRYNFKVEQGSTVDFTINYTDSSGTAIDLTDYEARMDIRAAAGSSTLYATLSSSLQSDLTGINMTPVNTAGLTLPKSSGSLRIYISAATSSAFDFKKAQYDLEVYSGSVPVTVNKILTGQINLIKEVTTSP